MSQIEQAKKVLLQGGIIIFPTDTVLGIGCLINFPESIEKLYQIKKRDKTKPTLVLASSLTEIEKLTYSDNNLQKLAKHFWPGALTIALPAKDNVPKGILGPNDTLAVRIPGKEWLLQLLAEVKVPLLAPSANLQGHRPVKKIAEIDKELIKLVDYVVDIEPAGQEPSTIISLQKTGQCEIIREGQISKQMIDQVLADN